jgi:hypothetical protein
MFGGIHIGQLNVASSGSVGDSMISGEEGQCRRAFANHV